jgi:hypothetical protein
MHLQITELVFIEAGVCEKLKIKQILKSIRVKLLKAMLGFGTVRQTVSYVHVSYENNTHYYTTLQFQSAILPFQGANMGPYYMGARAAGLSCCF